MARTAIDQALDEIKAQILKSAELTSTSGLTFSPTTRSVFSPENMDEKIKFLVPIDTPLRNRFPRAEGKGQHAEWKKMTTALHSKMHPSGYVGTGQTSYTSISFADGGAPGETSQTYSAAVAAYKLLGRKLEVGGLAIAASRGRNGEPDMQKSRERVKMYEVMLGEEELIIVGDTDNSNEFNGLYESITTSSGNTAFLTASGIGNFSRQLYAYGGDPTLLVASPRQLQALADDLEKSGSIIRHTVTQSEVAGVVGGYALSKIVNPVTQSLIDVKPSRFVGFGGLLLTEKSPAGEIWIEMEDLIPMSRVDVPSSNFSYVSFILEATVLKLIGEVYQLKFNTIA